MPKLKDHPKPLRTPVMTHTIVFDFDGTIADTFTPACDIIINIADEYGFKKVSREDILELRKKPYQEIIKYLQIPLLKLPLIATRARSELYKDITKIPTVNGMKPILLQLRDEGFRLCILTSNSAENVSKFLDQHEMQWFDGIYTVSSLWGKKKTIRTILNEYKLDPEHLILIGDETRDIEAAQKNNVRMIAVAWGFNDVAALRDLEAEMIIHQTSELIPLIHQMVRKG